MSLCGTVCLSLDVCIMCLCLISEYSNSLSFSSGAGPPSVPKPPTMLEVGIKHLTLAWEPPESNGADITAYTLEMENPQSVSATSRSVKPLIDLYS